MNKCIVYRTFSKLLLFPYLDSIPVLLSTCGFSSSRSVFSIRMVIIIAILLDFQHEHSMPYFLLNQQKVHLLPCQPHRCKKLTFLFHSLGNIPTLSPCYWKYRYLQRVTMECLAVHII